MQEANDEYRGYRIVVTPIKDHNDLWDFEYRITPIDGGESRTRGKTAGGYLTEQTACFGGMAVAHTEIDNLLALGAPKQAPAV